MKYHLCIFPPGWIELILEGDKTIESRFSKVKCAPFRKVHEGDVVFMKESGGFVKGQFTVAKVQTFQDMTTWQTTDIFQRYRNEIFVSYSPRYPSLPEKWLESKYATLIHIADPVAFHTPFAFPKRDRRAWVVLEHPLHTCQECGDPFLLDVYETPDGELVHGSQHFCSPCYARTCVSPDEEVAMTESVLL